MPDETESIYQFTRSGHGVRFFFAEDLNEEDEMTWDTLAFCVRNDERYAYGDGQTIADAGSHSDQELWTDVVCPAIERGDIEVLVWGTRVFEPAAAFEVASELVATVGPNNVELAAEAALERMTEAFNQGDTAGAIAAGCEGRQATLDTFKGDDAMSLSSVYGTGDSHDYSATDSDGERIDLRDLSREELDAYRSDAAAHGDDACVATINRLLEAE
jgi:hypothetical protein